MVDTPLTLAERLRQEGEKTTAFFHELPATAWQQQVYAGEVHWSAQDLLAHFASAEMAFTRLINNILAGGSGAPPDFDIDAFNAEDVQQLCSTSHEELLRNFDDQRHVNINIVENMQEEDLQRTGRHPFLGVVALEEIIKLLYRHNQIHQRDIRKMLNTLRQL